MERKNCTSSQVKCVCTCNHWAISKKQLPDDRRKNISQRPHTPSIRFVMSRVLSSDAIKESPTLVLASFVLFAANRPSAMLPISDENMFKLFRNMMLASIRRDLLDWLFDIFDSSLISGSRASNTRKLANTCLFTALRTSQDISTPAICETRGADIRSTRR